jgi:hypothetical protein
MNRAPRPLAALPLAAALACLLLAGCRVHNSKNGSKDDVAIDTPFGSMKVATDKSADTAAIGLAAYPGAVPVKDGNDSDSNSANVNLSFGSFHLGVKAASFQTPDQPEKVLAFYRKDLARYGDVIECNHDKPVGQPTRTSQGLACTDKGNTTRITSDKDGGLHINDSKSSDLELRAGSQTNQHIVSVEQKDGGTKIGLVALDLPSHLSDHGNNDAE